MTFLDCPAYLDQDGTARCGLPAEVRCWFTVSSSKGPLETAMIRCPAGHWFNGPSNSSPGKTGTSRIPGAGAVAPSARRSSRTGGRDGSGAAAGPPGYSQRSPDGKPLAQTAPAYYLGRPPVYGTPPCARAAGAPHLIT
jgi:hypothetical protein